METGTPAKAWLVLIGGPAIAPIELTDVPGGATLGRGEGVALPVPPTADKVSRHHCRFVFDPRDHDGDGKTDAGGWRIADLGSRWGTSVNGVRLAAHREVPLSDGDLVRIEPWTFSFTTRGLPGRGLKSEDDEQTMHTLVRSFGPTDALDAQPTRMGEDRLALLLESAAAIHAAETETALAEALLDAAARGTGLANAAVLRPLDSAGHIQVIAARRTGENAPAGFSRTLIDAAGNGVVAELSGDSHFNAAMSIVDLGIRSAICALLMLGGAAAAYLYLDDRGARSRSPQPRHGAAQFALALSRMAGLALANLKRIEIEKRQAALELDLSAAAKAQKWILPKRVFTGRRVHLHGRKSGGCVRRRRLLRRAAAGRSPPGGRARRRQRPRRGGQRADDRRPGLPPFRTSAVGHRRRGRHRSQPLRLPAPPGEQLSDAVGRRLRFARENARLRQRRPRVRAAGRARRPGHARRRRRLPRRLRGRSHLRAGHRPAARQGPRDSGQRRRGRTIRPRHRRPAPTVRHQRRPLRPQQPRRR
ncbi:MAG: FHA domain-containing protein [Tepidisphaeraceae bacterium]